MGVQFDPNVGATIITVVGGALFTLAMWLVTKKKPGLAPDPDGDASALVRQVATGEKTYGPEALIAMAQMLTRQDIQIAALEQHERRYLERISTLESWGMWAQGPPPRPVPEWPLDPRRPADG